MNVLVLLLVTLLAVCVAGEGDDIGVKVLDDVAWTVEEASKDHTLPESVRNFFITVQDALANGRFPNGPIGRLLQDVQAARENPANASIPIRNFMRSMSDARDELMAQFEAQESTGHGSITEPFMSLLRRAKQARAENGTLSANFIRTFFKQIREARANGELPQPIREFMTSARAAKHDLIDEFRNQEDGPLGVFFQRLRDGRGRALASALRGGEQ